MFFSGQQVLQEGLGGAVPYDPLVDGMNRRKAVAIPSTGGFKKRAEPLFLPDLVAPGERVAQKEHPELVRVILLHWLSVSVSE
jgi:hypothetical protein